MSSGSRVQIFVSYRRGLDDGLRARIADVLAKSFASAKLFFDEPASLAVPMPQDFGAVDLTAAAARRFDDDHNSQGGRPRRQNPFGFEWADAVLLFCLRRGAHESTQIFKGGDWTVDGGRRRLGISDFCSPLHCDNQERGTEYSSELNYKKIETEKINAIIPIIGSDGLLCRVSNVPYFDAMSSGAIRAVSRKQVATFSALNSLGAEDSPVPQASPRRLTSTDRSISKSIDLSAVDLMAYNNCIRELYSIGFGCAIGGVFGCGPSSASVLPVWGCAVRMTPVANRQERSMPRQSDTETARSMPRPGPREKKRKIECQIIRLPSLNGPGGGAIAERSVSLQSRFAPETPAVPADEADDKPLLEEVSLRNFGKNIDRMIADMAQQRGPARPNGRSRK